MKKILLFLCLFFVGFLNVYGADSNGLETLTDEQMQTLEKGGTITSIDSNGNTVTLSNSSSSSSSGGAGDLTSPDFQINVDDISPGIVGQGKTTKERVNWLLGTFIQNMMIALGILSVFIMTIGSGYMILHNGQDELLSKGKSIFMSGVYAMIVALTSYYLIAIVSYLLYKN